MIRKNRNKWESTFCVSYNHSVTIIIRIKLHCECLQTLANALRVANNRCEIRSEYDAGLIVFLNLTVVRHSQGMGKRRTLQAPCKCLTNAANASECLYQQYQWLANA